MTVFNFTRNSLKEVEMRNEREIFIYEFCNNFDNTISKNSIFSIIRLLFIFNFEDCSGNNI